MLTIYDIVSNAERIGICIICIDEVVKFMGVNTGNKERTTGYDGKT